MLESTQTHNSLNYSAYMAVSLRMRKRIDFIGRWQRRATQNGHRKTGVRSISFTYGKRVLCMYGMYRVAVKHVLAKPHGAPWVVFFVVDVRRRRRRLRSRTPKTN